MTVGTVFLRTCSSPPYLFIMVVRKSEPTVVSTAPMAMMTRQAFDQVFGAKASQVDLVVGKVGACCGHFFSEDDVIARHYEEGDLVGVCGSGLDRPNGVPASAGISASAAGGNHDVGCHFFAIRRR